MIDGTVRMGTGAAQELHADEELAVPASDAVPAPWVGYSLEGARWLIGSAGFLIAVSFSNSTADLLHLFAPFLLLALAGMNGLEETLFSKHAATLWGREAGPHRRQLGFCNLALAVTGLISFAQNWGSAADVALVTVLLIYTTLSSADHLLRALTDGQPRVRCVIRAAGTVALLVSLVPLLLVQQ